MRRPMIAAALLFAAPAHAEAGDALARLLNAHWDWYLAANPVTATGLGVRVHDARLADATLAEADRQAAAAAGFLKRAEAIQPTTLTAQERTTLAILKRVLGEQVEANRYPQRAVTFTSYAGWASWLTSLPEQVPLFTRADYDSYVARLEAIPAFARGAVETTRAGLKAGVVQPCAPFDGFEKTIRAHVVADPEASVFAAPFAARPAAIPDADWQALRRRALIAIGGGVVPAFRDFDAFYTREYRPKCRASVGVSATPQGRDFYAFRVRVETTTDLTPDAIHAIGLAEVARIRSEMDKVVAASGFKGDRAAYVALLRRDQKYYAKDADTLLREAAFVSRTIDGHMPRLFGRLPRLPYTVKAIPADIAERTTTAYYEQGSPTSGRAGVYRVNTSKLDQRPLYELPALTLHEAVPGHHHQIALQQELDLPAFRKHAVGFTAFVEGWALYAESLGDAMGLYDTPEKQMGRLSYEMWRACRLVVDTGLHAKGWSKQQAVDFMLANTALSPANIDAEVNRYISWPGQALAYKLGELRIKELRAKAERDLGPRFDVRGFHDAVLEQGPVPLDVLDAQVTDWIATTRSRAN